MTDVGVDMITKKLRTPRDQYTELTETQLRNIRQNRSAFFDISKPGWQPSRTPYKNGERATIKRFAHSANENLFRGRTLRPGCWIGEQVTTTIPEDHNTSRLGASLPWGPEKQGSRTLGHPENDETWRFMKIGMYCRHPTSIPGEPVMKFGRPHEGYYAQRFPNNTTWFRSSAPLNRVGYLDDIHKKTQDEYDAIRAFKQNHIRRRVNKFPEFSEYTDKFALFSKIDPIPVTFLERKKLMMAQEARAEEEARIEAELKAKEQEILAKKAQVQFA